MEEPLIYTSKGNLPVASLRYEHRWEATDTYIKFVERYFLQEEVVKESAHVMVKQGAIAQAKQGEFCG